MSDGRSGNGVFSRVGRKLGRALDRADELGGRVRVAVSQRLQHRAPPFPASEPRAAKEAPATVQPFVSESPPKAEVARAGFGDPARAVQVFGRKSCSWSWRAVGLLKSAGIDYSYIELSAYGMDSIRKQLEAETQQGTVPYIYVRGRFIGGFDALDEMHRIGQLEYLALTEEERLASPIPPE